MLELAALFMSNWGLDSSADNASVDGHSQVVSDDRSGIYFDQDGNIIEGFRDDTSSVDDVFDGHGLHTKGRRRWGEEAVFWFDRAVRRETKFTSLWTLGERASIIEIRIFPSSCCRIRDCETGRDLLAFVVGFAVFQCLTREAHDQHHQEYSRSVACVRIIP